MSPDNAGHPEETELSQSDYPDTKFWKREAWSKHEKELKDSLQLDGSGHQSSPQGDMRAANRENVMMQYLEEADGTTVSGTIAANIWNWAWSIWIYLYKRDLAPLTWGNVSKVVQDEYYNNIESKFKGLGYCKNHWKAQAVTTAIYSQWHSVYHLKQLKRTVKAEPANANEPPTKQPKTETRGTSNMPLGALSQMVGIGQPQGDNTAGSTVMISQSRCYSLRLHNIYYSVGLFNTQNTMLFAVLDVVPEDITAPTLNVDECDPHINNESCKTGKPNGASPPSPQHPTPPGPVSPPLNPNDL
ncbi:hypothetical protein EDB85DRAFT_1895705 [Lactarius pseudohatsudake]|nr:hypothetical protein EDB85DRAFT_1895705 [Lactarius pseudohatsudake]